MKIKFILPALTEALRPSDRSVKYALFPPLGLATLAAYLQPMDEAWIEDEHVMPIHLEDQPDLVAIEVYITSAYRAYEIADQYRSRGVHVALGGLHVTTLPDEAANHADTIFIGPGEDTWPMFLTDFRCKRTKKIYKSQVRTLDGAPFPRRDLIERWRYLVPNSIVVSRGCPHACDFCYKQSFYKGGRSFYTYSVDRALTEIDGLKGKHLYFLDDHLFGNPKFAAALFGGLEGMGRVWQAAGTVKSVLQPNLVEKAAAAGLRSLFIGFETLNLNNLLAQNKTHNLRQDYHSAIRKLHDLGVMVNASFVFGLDEDDESVFERTVEWAVREGIETATFHILTPYPGTPLYQRMAAQGRLLTTDWNRYDTRHAVFQPAGMTPEALEAGYWWAKKQFYSWESILKSAWSKTSIEDKIRHLAYTGGWKKTKPLWNSIIRTGNLSKCIPILETVLAGFDQKISPQKQTKEKADPEPESMII